MEETGSVEPHRIRIDEKFCGVEAVSGLAVVGTMGPQPITRACAKTWDEAEMDVALPAGQGQTIGFERSGRIEEAELDHLGMGGKDGEMNAVGIECRAEPVGAAAFGCDSSRHGVRVPAREAVRLSFVQEAIRSTAHGPVR